MESSDYRDILLNFYYSLIEYPLIRLYVRNNYILGNIGKKEYRIYPNTIGFKIRSLCIISGSHCDKIITSLNETESSFYSEHLLSIYPNKNSIVIHIKDKLGDNVYKDKINFALLNI